MKLDNIKYISTKNGDKGESKNYNNISFKKSDIIFEVLGTIDELSSYLGLIYHHTKYENIIIIQKNLQKINSIIATYPDSDKYKLLEQIKDKDVLWLEEEMQKLLNIKPLDSHFFLPGSEKSLNGAYFDYSRTLARRAERRINEFVLLHKRADLGHINQYINRLSDYLYIVSCSV